MDIALSTWSTPGSRPLRRYRTIVTELPQNAARLPPTSGRRTVRSAARTAASDMRTRPSAQRTATAGVCVEHQSGVRTIRTLALSTTRPPGPVIHNPQGANHMIRKALGLGRRRV